MTCGYEAPTWAHYPDGRCIDGYLWDLDSGDGEFLTNGGDVPCPACNTVEYIDYTGSRPSGNARQRRRVIRIAARKVRLWAMRRSSFPCGVRPHPEGQQPNEPVSVSCWGLSSFCAEDGHKCRAAGRCVYAPPAADGVTVLIDPTTDLVISEHTNEHEAIREARSLLDEGKSVEIVQSGVDGVLTQESK